MISNYWRAASYRARRLLAAAPPDIDQDTVALFKSVAPYTMTGIERISALRQSVQHIAKRRIEGAIVECGVWKGGSMMAIAKTLHDLRERRDLYLFDTFEGMPPPTEVDVNVFGIAASTLLKFDPMAPARAGIDEVRANMSSTGYDPALVHYIVGKVEDTVPSRAPEKIALLRLDTDWYESTRHELGHLYPRLSPGGIMIIDDYGHFAGSKLATDEYFAGDPVFLNRIDYSGRLVIKP